MSLLKDLPLNNGLKMPNLGFGTWQSEPEKVTLAVELALKTGYRHIDCAAVYGNEKEVGTGIRASGVPREEIFVTSKLWNNKHHPDDVEAACDQTLNDLGLEYLDLYLIHWPTAFGRGEDKFPKDSEKKMILQDVPITDTWAAMEKLVQKGKVRSIGISNFTIEYTQKILDSCTIKPVNNQIEAHPQLQQPKLMEFMKKHEITVTGYSTLGNDVYGVQRIIENPKIKQLASELNISPANLLFAWALQRGTAVLAKSVTPERIVANFKHDYKPLPEDVFAAIGTLDEHRRFNNTLDWGVDEIGEYTQADIDAAVKASQEK